MFFTILDVTSKKKLFKSNARLLNYCHVIPFANLQSELSRTVNNHIHYVKGLGLGIQRSIDVIKLKKCFDSREYSRNRFSRMICCILGDVLSIDNFVGNQLTIVFLEVSGRVRHVVINGDFRAIAISAR